MFLSLPANQERYVPPLPICQKTALQKGRAQSFPEMSETEREAARAMSQTASVLQSSPVFLGGGVLSFMTCSHSLGRGILVLGGSLLREALLAPGPPGTSVLLASS